MTSWLYMKIQLVNVTAYNPIFSINLLQLFYNILSTIRTAIIHNNNFKISIPELSNKKKYS